jgi:hypothetical protein
MASPPSHVQALLPDPVSLKLKFVQNQDEGRVLIVVAGAGSSARCVGMRAPFPLRPQSILPSSEGSAMAGFYRPDAAYSDDVNEVGAKRR